MASQPAGAIEKRWALCKRGFGLCKQHSVLFFFTSGVGALIVLPWIFRFFAAAIYAVVCYIVFKSSRGESLRILGIFKAILRYRRAVLLWCFLIALLELCIRLMGVGIVPVIWAIVMLVLPPLVDARKSITITTVFAWENWARFWLYGLTIPLLCYRGVSALFYGLFITVPIAVCLRVIVYGDSFAGDALQQEEPEPNTQYTGAILRIRQHCDQIIEQIRSANNTVKPLLESSIEYIDSIFEKAADLNQRLQQIDGYLHTTSKQTLQAEKTEITKQLFAAPNSAVSAQYEEALRALEERNENHGRLEIVREEINARLTTIRVTLDNTHAKIIRIKTTELKNVHLERDNVSETLRNLQIETDILLETLNEIAETK